MKYNEISKNTLANLKPQHIRMYLNSQGWTKAYHESKFDIYRKDDAEILVPAHQELRDYLYRMEDMLDILSDMEERPFSSIISSIMFATAADVIEYRYNSPDDEYGVIPIEDMSVLLSAHIDITNFAYRDLTQWKQSYANSRWEGSNVTERVKMGQTGAGSYLVRFMYPSIISSGVQRNLDGNCILDDNMLRAICDKTLRSLDVVVDHAEEGKETIGEDEKISYNFINSVMSLDFKANADLEVRKLPLQKNLKEDTRVVMTKKVFYNISNIEKAMRPLEMKREMEFFGWLVRVQDERFQSEDSTGQLTIQYMNEDKPARAKLSLKDDDLLLAYDAMKEQKPVKLKGTLVGAGRSRRIENPCDLRKID